MRRTSTKISPIRVVIKLPNISQSGSIDGGPPYPRVLFFAFLSHLLTVRLSPPKVGPVVSRPVVLLPHAEKTRAARMRLHLTEVVANTTEAFLPLPLAHLYYWIELAVLEKTLLAFVPMSLMVPTTSTKITASITAYSAMSWPASSDHRLQRRLVKVRLLSHSETTRVYTFPSGSRRFPRSKLLVGQR